MTKLGMAGAALALLAAGAAQAVTVTNISGTGEFSNSPALLTDGDFGLGSWWTDAPNVFWTGQTGASGVALTLTFDKRYTLTDLRIGADNNDFYAVQVSTNGVVWNTLALSLSTGVDTSYEYAGNSMIKRSSVAGEAAYSSLIDFAPVEARYARVFAIAGDGSYAVSELQFSGVAAPVPEPGPAALWAAGLGVMALVGMRRRQA